MRISEFCYFTRYLLHSFCPLSEHSPPVNRIPSYLFALGIQPAFYLSSTHPLYQYIPLESLRSFNQHRYPLLRQDQLLTPIVGEHPSLQILSSHLFVLSFCSS